MMYSLSPVELEALMATAAAAGAKKALHDIGLHDTDAGNDVRQLRSLLEAWRMAKRETWKTVIQWCIGGLLTLLVATVLTKVDVVSHFVSIK